MAIQTGDSDEVVSEINVTPLVDVMLVLLVVFIVTAPLLNNAVTVQLPQTTTVQRPEPQLAVTVSVDARGTIFIDKAETSLGTLEPELRKLRSSAQDFAVHLNADETSNYGLVAKVMAAVNRAGVTKLSVLSVGE